MLQVSITQLLSNIKDVPTFKLPKMDKGTAYLFHKVYVPLSKGKNVTISSLDFDAFSEEDLQTLNCLYDEIFETNSNNADRIKQTLQSITPMCKPVPYI